MIRVIPLVLALLGLLATPAACAAGDPVRGEKLHAKCESCHRTDPYAPERRKVKTLPALRREVERWSETYNPRLPKQDIDDLVAWLNRDFYRFPE